MAKAKRRFDSYVTCSGESNALILSSISSSESWVIDLGAFFHATSRHKICSNYMKGDLEKVYLRGDELCNIIVRAMTISLSNGSTLKLKDVR